MTDKSTVEFSLSRVVNAPPDLVFEGWTEPERLKTWWGPKGFDHPVLKVDARTGGEAEIVMGLPDGPKYHVSEVFREVDRPAKLAFSFKTADSEGKVLLEGDITATFMKVGSTTRLTVKARSTGHFASVAKARAGFIAGWNQSLDRLIAS